ncbi:MAG: 4-alpha-glucanotransferase, partial [Alphaproteobacteria bacterium]
RPPEDPSAAVDGAMRYVARAPARLALFPLVDALGLPEQPNLPGTIDEHPNWRRRLPGTADTILDDPVAATRLRTVARERKRR